MTADTPAVSVLPVTGIGDVTPGADLAGLLIAAAPWLADGDILVVTSKIVSKAEGRLVRVPASGDGREAARQAAITAEAVRTVAERGATRIVQTRHGLVLAAAGVDASNVDQEHLVLLPEDPDASARALRAAIRDRYGRRVAVVVTDTMGRPWRLGLTDVGIGAAGIQPYRDYRGQRDAYGNELQLTQMAVIDEIAGAGELVKGKYDQVPVAVVRGMAGHVTDQDGPGASALVRDAELDLFSLGTAEARARGQRDIAELRDAASFGTDPVAGVLLDVALATVPGTAVRVAAAERDKLLAEIPFPAAPWAPGASAPAGSGTGPLVPGATELLVPYAPPEPVAAARCGADVHRIRGLLATEGLVTAWLRVAPEVIGPFVVLPTGTVPLGVLAVGRP